MRKLLICALALGGFAASAQAADLSVDSLKDPLPEGPLTYKGVTFYGTVDVGYAYQTEGAPYNGSMYTGLGYVVQKDARGAVSSLTNNAFSQSGVGAKIEENLGMGFVAIGKLDTGFNPASGQISDACASLVQNNGKTLQTQNTAIDGGRCGQAFNNEAYGGLSSSTYGTLTMGRQQSLINGALSGYDAQHASYAFSLIGFSGGAAGGIGSTETTRWDELVKYTYQYGPLHASGMYANGDNGSEIWGKAYGASVGGSYKGFSLDGFYEKEKGAVGAGSLSAAQTALTPTMLAGTITDNEAYAVMGKYTLDLGGGFKDEGPSSKLNLFAGYVHMDLTNPDNAYAGNNGTIGGYQFASVNVTPYGKGATKTLQTEWAGASYETGRWTLAGAYYHESQNDYTDNSSHTCAQANALKAGVTQGNCSGDLNMGSFSVDYAFSKHFDVYSGVSYSTVGGGLASGFLNSDTTTVATGVRLKF